VNRRCKVYRNNVSRREFIESLVAVGLSVGLTDMLWEMLRPGEVYGQEGMREASWYKTLGKEVQCFLCPKGCRLSHGETCFCRTRINQGGKLYTTAWGNPSVVELTGIENGPLYHFMPGMRVLSVGVSGCNLRCLYCQNWTVSQASPPKSKTLSFSGAQVLKAAGKKACQGIAFNYTEPVAFYDYMLDVAERARLEGLRVTVATAGCINPSPLRELCRRVDAFTVTLKGFNEDFYQKVCGSSLEAVLKTLEVIREEGKWLEVVNLIVPSLNEDLTTIGEMTQWIRTNLGGEVPLHFSRFFPAYKLAGLPETPISTLERAREVALRNGVKYVYVTNLPGHVGNNTYCFNCGGTVVARKGFETLNVKLTGGRCPSCKNLISGVWI
jgi:pyruvate formate lyase activating enzyme